jgi:hypothetical protein
VSDDLDPLDADVPRKILCPVPTDPSLTTLGRVDRMCSEKNPHTALMRGGVVQRELRMPVEMLFSAETAE